MKRILTAIVTFIFGVCLLFSVAATASAASVKKVSNFKATATHITATLTWEKTSGATGYEIQQKDGKKWKTVTTIKKAATTSYTVKKLKNDKSYEFRIRAVKGKSKGKYVTVKVKTSVPKVTSFKASVTGATTAKLTWAKANVTGYEIQVKSGSNWKSVTKIKKAATTSYTVKNVPVNATTTYRIRGYITGTGKTYYGAYTEVKVKTSIPKVSSFKASVSGPSTAKFTWAKANVTGYEIQLKSGKDWKTVKKITKAATTSVTLNDVIPNATSSYRIRGYVTASGKTYYGSASSEVKVKTSIAKISSFKASVSGPSSAKFTWAKANVTGYEIQLKSGSTWKTVSTVKNAATVSATLNNITPNTTNSYRIRGYVTVSGKNYYGSASSEVSVKTTVPGVSSFKASVSGLTTATFTWAKANVTGYEIQIKSGDSWKTVSTVKDAATVSLKLTNVPADTTSSYRIRGYVTVSGKNYYGSASSAIEVKTAVKAMGTASVSSVTSNSATITWAKVSDVSGYQVEKYQGGKWVSVNSKIASGTTSCTVSGLSALTSYQIRIRAYQTVGSSTYYNSWKTVNAKTKIGTSGNLKVSSISTTSAKLTWTAAAGATAYQVLNNGKEIADVKTNSVTLEKLASGTTYKITVVPYSGSTKAAATSAVTFTTKCAKVTGVKVTTTETTASVSWSKATGAASYQLQYRKEGGDWSSNIAVSGTSYNLSGLPLNTAYDFRVRALNKNGSTTQYGDYSSVVSERTHGLTLVSDKISWREISGAKYYEVQCFDVESGSWKTAAEDADKLTKTSYTNKTLFADKSKLFRVIATDSNGKTVHTSKTITSKLSEFVFSLEKNVLSVSWSEIADASKYEVVILSEGMEAGGKSVNTVKAADRKLTRNLAPGLKYDVKVLAVKGSTDSVIAHFSVKTTDLVLNDTDESKTAQLLYLVEAINRSKFDNSKRTILKVKPYNLNEVKYMDFGFVFDDFWAPIKRGVANTLLNTLFGSAMSDKGLKKKSIINNKNYDYDVDKGFIKCYTAAAIDTLFASMEDDGKAEKVSKTETGGRIIPYTFNEGVHYGDADYKLADLIQPTGNVDGLAYLHNSNNISAWKNGFSSVTTTKTETGYRVEATLKQETTPNYHSGFIATSVSGDFGLGDIGGSNVNSTAGATVITAEIDGDCRLTSYYVNSPYKYDMNVNLSIDTEDADAGDNAEMGELLEGLSKIVMEMNVKAEGYQEYEYSFVRTK